MEKWGYDSIEGIKNSLNSLREFNQMLIERKDAFYCRKETLNEFVIMGRWWLDTCGNCCTATKEFIPAEHIPNFPKVVYKDDFLEIMHRYDVLKNPNVLTNEEIRSPDFDYSTNIRPYPLSMSWGLGWHEIPPTGILCHYCKKYWNMDNVSDSIRREQGYECISLKDFIGKSFKKVKDYFYEWWNPDEFSNNKGIYRLWWD